MSFPKKLYSFESNKLIELEEEYRKLKQLYGSFALDNRILKDVIEKSFWSLYKNGEADIFREGHRGIVQ